MSEYRTPSQRRQDRKFDIMCADVKIKHDELWEAYFELDSCEGETRAQWMDRKLTEAFQSSELPAILRVGHS